MSNVRTFRAADARSALAAVKAALGSEAVILATREVDNGLFRASEIEVTASVPDPEPEPIPTPAPGRSGRAVYTPMTPPTPQEPAATPPNLRPRTDPALAGELVKLRSALEDMRSELRTRSRALPGLNLPPLPTNLFAHLCGRGMEESLAEEAVRQAVASGATSGPALLTAIRDVLSERLVSSRAPWLPDRRRVLALVGPTGVGKTTTLAKIAARALLESHQKVALITVDTYRIGATEQMARYGEIMNAPTHVAKDRAELAAALERCRDADLVLIDTAGRSLPEAVAKQAELIRSIPTVQLYLVLSAATGARELAATAERYRALSPERLIFTKVDETTGPASLVSAAVRIGRPVCAVADGQRVPEDLHGYGSGQLVELVLGDWTDHRASATGA